MSSGENLRPREGKTTLDDFLLIAVISAIREGDRPNLIKQVDVASHENRKYPGMEALSLLEKLQPGISVEVFARTEEMLMDPPDIKWAG